MQTKNAAAVDRGDPVFSRGIPSFPGGSCLFQGDPVFSRGIPSFPGGSRLFQGDPVFSRGIHSPGPPVPCASAQNPPVGFEKVGGICEATKSEQQDDDTCRKKTHRCGRSGRVSTVWRIATSLDSLEELRGVMRPDGLEASLCVWMSLD